MVALQPGGNAAEVTGGFASAGIFQQGQAEGCGQSYMAVLQNNAQQWQTDVF